MLELSKKIQKLKELLHKSGKISVKLSSKELKEARALVIDISDAGLAVEREADSMQAIRNIISGVDMSGKTDPELKGVWLSASDISSVFDTKHTYSPGTPGTKATKSLIKYGKKAKSLSPISNKVVKI